MSDDHLTSSPPESVDDDALPSIRTRIDLIDVELARLIHMRAAMAEDIRAAKTASRLPVYDPDREDDVIESAVSRSKGCFPLPAMRAVFREIISGCISLQQSTSIAFVGPMGSFAESAAHALFGSSTAYVERPTIAGVLDAVASGSVAYGIIPFQTSVDGFIVEAVDGLIERSLRIRREYVNVVSYDVCSRASNFGSIERIYADRGAFRDCRRWLQENLPRAALIPVDLPVTSALRANADPAGAALLPSSPSIDRGRLRAVANRAGDRLATTVRFVVAGREDVPSRRANRTLVVVTPRTASLASILATFGTHGLDVVRIASVPRAADLSEQLLFEVAGQRDNTKLAAFVADIVSSGAEVNVLGSYVAHEVKRPSSAPVSSK